MSLLFKKFVIKYGYGPFDEIFPTTFTGKVVEVLILEREGNVRNI